MQADSAQYQTRLTQGALLAVVIAFAILTATTAVVGFAGAGAPEVQILFLAFLAATGGIFSAYILRAAQGQS